MDSEEAIQFTELENIKCMVQEYPLEKANEAFGKSHSFNCVSMPRGKTDR